MAHRHAVKVATLPVRLGAAVGAVAVAYYWPIVALLLGAFAVAVALASIVTFQVLRRVSRQVGRAACPACGYMALRDAWRCAGCGGALQPEGLADVDYGGGDAS